MPKQGIGFQSHALIRTVQMRSGVLGQMVLFGTMSEAMPMSSRSFI